MQLLCPLHHFHSHVSLNPLPQLQEGATGISFLSTPRTVVQILGDAGSLDKIPAHSYAECSKAETERRTPSLAPSFANLLATSIQSMGQKGVTGILGVIRLTCTVLNVVQVRYIQFSLLCSCVVISARLLS